MKTYTEEEVRKILGDRLDTADEPGAIEELQELLSIFGESEEE